MITAKNYAAKAQRDMYSVIKHFERRGWEVDAGSLSMIVNSIDEAVHFSLPEKGVLFQTDLRSISDQHIRLPFPKVTLEFDLPVDNFGSKCVIVAQEVNKTELQDYRKLNIDSDIVILVITIAYNTNFNQWATLPYCYAIPSSWNDSVDDGDPLSFKPICLTMLPNMEKELITQTGNGERLSRAFANYNSGIVLGFIEALSCSNITFEPINKINPLKNEKRVKSGKLPIFETNVLTIKTPLNRKVTNNDTTGLTKNSPREHLRRGHIRRLDENRKIWVNACVVNAGSKNGKIVKSYNIIK